MPSKRSLIKWHRRIGIVIAFLLLLQAATGMMISWRWELAGFIDPAGMTADGVSEGTPGQHVLQRASPQLPDSSAIRIYYPQDVDGVYLLQLETRQGTQFVSVNPADSRILRQGSIWRFPTEAALKLHFQALPGTSGYLLTMILGLALTTMIITGLLIWWPRNRQWLSALRIDPGIPMRRLTRQLHRTLGIATLPLVLVIALTGFLLAAEMLVDAAGAPRVAPAAYSPTQFNGLDQAVAAAKRAFPAQQVRDIRISPERAIAVQLWDPERDPWTIHRVTTAGGKSGKVTILPADERQALWPALLPIHTGTLLGTAGRLIATGVAFALIVLTGIGLYLWLAGTRRQRR